MAKRTAPRTSTRSAPKTPRKAGAASNEAWLVVHVEFMGCTSHPRLDSLPLHVASTRAGALARTKDVDLGAMGWWEIYRFARDSKSIEADEQSGLLPELYVDHRGKVVEQPDVKRARAKFDRERAKDIAGGVFPDGEHQCEVCHAASKSSAVSKAASTVRSKRAKR
jgi:hypothetical protein